jgi:hypothetical protein
VIGNWRLKFWIRQTTGRACMKSLTRLDPSSRRPWVRAAPLISIAGPPGKLESRRVKYAVKDLKRPRVKYSLLGTKNRLPSNRQRMLFAVVWRSDYEVVK